MRLRQYVVAERTITIGERNDIRERWMFGLRLLADPEATSSTGSTMRRGFVPRLVEASRVGGLKLSEREVQLRVQAARTYPTEGQMRQALTHFETWTDLVNARFPAYPREPDEQPADWRTVAERNADLKRQLAEKGLDQLELWPFDFEPRSSTLKDLSDFLDRQDRITEGFIAVGKKRRAEFEAMSEAVEHDWSTSWRDAHLAAFGVDIDPDDGDES